jgi:hypothetical protein
MFESNSIFLSQDELVELTGRKHRACQARVLRGLGIEHKVRADGRVMVLRQHVKEQFGARRDRTELAEIEPDWSAA